MDTALKDGDFKINSRGYPITIDSYDEILQRVIIRLLCKKGSFVYDTDLGSELYKLKYSQIADGNIEKQALKYAREALKNIEDAEVDSVLVKYDESKEQLNLNFTIIINGVLKEASITI